MAEGIRVEFQRGTRLTNVERGIIVGILTNHFQTRQVMLATMALVQASRGETPQAVAFEDGQMQALLAVREFAEKLFPALGLTITLSE